VGEASQINVTTEEIDEKKYKRSENDDKEIICFSDI